MDKAIYQVVFSGKIIEGRNIDQVKKNMVALFKKSPEQVEALFSGGPVIIKKDADKETALKYQAILKKAGALCQIQTGGQIQTEGQVHTGHQAQSTAAQAAKQKPTKTQTAPPSPASSEQTKGKKPRMLRATRDDVNLSVDDSFQNLTLAEPGAILGTPHKVVEVMIEGIDSLSLSDLNVLLAKPSKVKPQVIEDVSWLELESLEEAEAEEDEETNN